MNRHAPPPSRGNSTMRSLRLNPLMACLAFAPLGNATASVVHVVTECSDVLATVVCDGPDDGTLRKAFTCAQSGDTIDLTQLQCSKITLSAPLITNAASLTLAGPGQDKLTIDGGGQSRIFAQYGSSPYDSLYINHLTIADGYFNNSSINGGGGCIYSTAYVLLNFSTVTSCYETAQVFATGGAIYARGVGLYRSTVTGSRAQGNDYVGAWGGGIYADIVELDQSTVAGNTALSTIALGYGGGVVASTTLYANRSTISGNAADSAGGAGAGKLYLTDSTVSGNQTPFHGVIGGVYARNVARVISSTIARNSSGDGFAAGLFVPFPSVATVSLQSTIIAGNKANGAELDVGSEDGQTISGHNNLIMAHGPGTTVPADTLTADPMLGLLRDNGGPTQTHALRPGSLAIDHGANPGGLAFDQRGRPRVLGDHVDIGAYEFDPDAIFTTGFGP